MTPPLFHVVVRDDRAGLDHYMTARPVPHPEACTIKRKLIPDTRRPKGCRSMLVPALSGDEPSPLTRSFRGAL